MADLDFTPAVLNLKLYQGDDWSKTFRLGSRESADSDVVYYDLTGWEGKAQIRPKPSSLVVLAELTVDVLDQSDADTVGMVSVALSKDDATDLPRKCAWDLEFTDDTGFRRTYLAGTVVVSREVTKDAV